MRTLLVASILLLPLAAAAAAPPSGVFDKPLRTERVALTIAKAAPCGSRAYTIQAPPGTAIGPMRMVAPRIVALAAAAATLSTAI